MKHASMVALLALLAAPAWAEEGRVPKSTLSALGLSGMQEVSDADGMAVRGMAVWTADVKGTSLIFGQLLTPDTKNFVVASSVNEVDGAATNQGGDPTLTKTHAAFIGLTPVGGLFAITPVTLTVTYPGPPAFAYTGSMFGLAGGTGSITLTP